MKLCGERELEQEREERRERAFAPMSKHCPLLDKWPSLYHNKYFLIWSSALKSLCACGECE